MAGFKNRIFGKNIFLKVMLLLVMLVLSNNIKAVEEEIITGQKIKAKLINIPLIRQYTDHDCGAAALQSILAYYGDQMSEDMLIKELKTDENGTAWENIKAYAIKRGFTVKVFHNMELYVIKKELDNHRPVMLAIQAWATYPTNAKRNWESDWGDGHWVVAIGYDNKNIYFMDPSTLGNYTFIPLAEFLERWHDEDLQKNKLHHFGIIISKSKSAYDNNMILRMN